MTTNIPKAKAGPAWKAQAKLGASPGCIPPRQISMHTPYRMTDAISANRNILPNAPITSDGSPGAIAIAAKVEPRNR
jgi:hypothetical protein